MHLFNFKDNRCPKVCFDDGRRGSNQRKNYIIRIAPDKCTAIDRKSFRTTGDPDPTLNEKEPKENEKYICESPHCNQKIELPRKETETKPIITCEPPYTSESTCRKKCAKRRVKIAENVPCQLKIEENGDLVCGDESRKCFCDHNKQKTDEFEQSKLPKLCDSIHSLIHNYDTQPIKTYVAEKSSSVTLAVKSIFWKQPPPPPRICCVTRGDDENNVTNELQTEKSCDLCPACTINDEINLSKPGDDKTPVDGQKVTIDKGNPEPISGPSTINLASRDNDENNVTNYPQTEKCKSTCPASTINDDIKLSEPDNPKTPANGQIVTIGRRYAEPVRVQSSNKLALNIRIDPIDGNDCNTARPPDIVVLLKLDDINSQIKGRVEQAKAHSETRFSRLSMDALKQSTDALKSAMGVLKNKLDASKCAITNYINDEFLNCDSCDACKVAGKISDTVLETLKNKYNALTPCSLGTKYIDRCCSPIHVKVSSAQRNSKGNKTSNQGRCKVDYNKDSPLMRSEIRNVDNANRSAPYSPKRRLQPNSMQQRQQSRHLSTNKDCCGNLNKEIHHNRIEVNREKGRSSENMKPAMVHRASVPENTKLKAEPLFKRKTKFVVDEIKKDLYEQTILDISRHNHSKNNGTVSKNVQERDQNSVKLRKVNTKFTANKEFSAGECVKYTYDFKGDKKQTVIVKQVDNSERVLLTRAHKIINTNDKDLNIKLKQRRIAKNPITKVVADSEKTTINIFRKANFNAVESTSSMCLNMYDDIIKNCNEADFDKVASRLSKDEEMYLRNQSLNF